MKIIDAKYGAMSQILVISCDCGNTFYHDCATWEVVCPKCRRSNNIELLRKDIKPNQIKENR